MATTLTERDLKVGQTYPMVGADVVLKYADEEMVQIYYPISRATRQISRHEFLRLLKDDR